MSLTHFRYTSRYWRWSHRITRYIHLLIAKRTTIEIIVCSLYDLGDDDDDDEGMSFRKIPQDYIDQTGKVTLGVWLVLPFLKARYALSGKRCLVVGSRLTACNLQRILCRREAARERRRGKEFVGGAIRVLYLFTMKTTESPTVRYFLSNF